MYRELAHTHKKTPQQPSTFNELINYNFPSKSGPHEVGAHTPAHSHVAACGTTQSIKIAPS